MRNQYNIQNFEKLINIQIVDIEYFLKKARTRLETGDLNGAFRCLCVIKKAGFIYENELKRARIDILEISGENL